MNLVIQARDYAIYAHKGQRDKIGLDYFTSHVEPVANYTREYGGTTEQVAAAYLHDTVEDTHVTIDNLRRNFGFRVAEMVNGLTKRDGESYQQFICRLVNEHYDAILIKLADIRSNTDPSRMMYLPPDQRKYLASKYGRALPLLWEAL